MPRDVVAAALRAEGIPVATGVGRLMSDNELFLRRLAYGRAHYPFPDGIEYRPESLPRAHQAPRPRVCGVLPRGVAEHHR